MVATEVYSEGHATVFTENSVVCQCQCCTKLQLDLSEAVSEQKSAKKIIKIQHKEPNTADHWTVLTQIHGADTMIK